MAKTLRPYAEYKANWSPKPAGKKPWERLAEQTAVAPTVPTVESGGVLCGMGTTTETANQAINLGLAGAIYTPAKLVVAATVKVYCKVGDKPLKIELPMYATKAHEGSTTNVQIGEVAANTAAGWQTFALTKEQAERTEWKQTSITGITFKRASGSTETAVDDIEAIVEEEGEGGGGTPVLAKATIAAVFGESASPRAGVKASETIAAVFGESASPRAGVKASETIAAVFGESASPRAGVKASETIAAVFGEVLSPKVGIKANETVASTFSVSGAAKAGARTGTIIQSLWGMTDRAELVVRASMAINSTFGSSGSAKEGVSARATINSTFGESGTTKQGVSARAAISTLFGLRGSPSIITRIKARIEALFGLSGRAAAEERAAREATLVLASEPRAPVVLVSPDEPAMTVIDQPEPPAPQVI
jgi:hypothetical protein